MKKNRVYAGIDLDALRYNMESMHKNIKEGTKIAAVIKADAYGHGALTVAKTIEDLPYVWGFAVATADEAEMLIADGRKKPILILGISFPEHYELIVEKEIRPAICEYESAKALSDIAVRKNKTCHIHIKIDTGMSRIGLQVTEESADLVAKIAQLPGIEIEGIFTHFAQADEYDKTFTKEQIQKFRKMIAMMEDRGVSIPVKHCSNSAGIAEIREANMDMVRAGITLYGLWPSEEVDQNSLDLKPVMELKTHVAYVKDLEAGRAISYGGTFITKRDSRIATIPVGYADGYCRGLSNTGSVLIHGKRAPICGRVCMDQFMVDVTDIPDVKIGDEVTLIGRDGDEVITMEEVGSLSGRFNYEFVCVLGKRIPRVFYRDGKRIASQEYFDEE